MVQYVAVMFRLPLFVDHGASGIVLSEEEERTLQLLNVALRESNKSTYTSWIKYFRDSEGRQKGVAVEALLSYWLSWSIIPNEPKDRIKYICLPSGHPPEFQNNILRSV